MDNVSQAIVIGGYTEDSPLEMSYIGITDITGWWNEDSGEITATGTRAHQSDQGRVPHFEWHHAR